MILVSLVIGFGSFILTQLSHAIGKFRERVYLNWGEIIVAASVIMLAKYNLCFCLGHLAMDEVLLFFVLR